jgi:CyaY protein
MSAESDFSAIAERVLSSIGAALDDSTADVDWMLNDGVLTIDCGEGGRIIVNRHLPNREIWAAGRSGGLHFRADGARWRDTRSGEALESVLARLLREQADADVVLPALPAA